MSELDNFFGPKPPTEMPPAQPTHFGDFPAVQPLCDAFLEEMDWNPDPYTVQQIVAGAIDYALAVNHDPALLIRATKKMKRNEMSIGSPRSCITYGREMLHSPEVDTQKYRLPEDYDE